MHAFKQTMVIDEAFQHVRTSITREAVAHLQRLVNAAIEDDFIRHEEKELDGDILKIIIQELERIPCNNKRICTRKICIEMKRIAKCYNGYNKIK